MRSAFTRDRTAQKTLPSNRGFLLYPLAAHWVKFRERGFIQWREWLLARAYIPACEAVIELWEHDTTRAESVALMFEEMPDEEAELSVEPDDDEIVPLTHRSTRK